MSQQTQRRRRGILLTPQGLERLRAAIEQAELGDNDGKPYTLENLSERIRLDAKTIAKVLNGKTSIDKRTLDRCFRAFGLELIATDFSKAAATNRGGKSQNPPSVSQNQVDWGEAVDVSHFYGRGEELNTLKRWLVQDRCRVVALLGMGGVGKTSLSVKLAQQLQGQFEVTIWRSLRNAPPLSDLLLDLLQCLSQGQAVSASPNLGVQMSQLMGYLRDRRCLLILDNWETLLGSGAGKPQDVAGFYRSGYEGYGELLRQFGEMAHQSCLILTSREKPAEIATLEGETLPVRTLNLRGLGEEEAVQLLQAKGLMGELAQYSSLIQFYQGNPLGLKIVATTIQDIFAGEIGEFLAQRITVFNGLRLLLEQQFQRLSDLERKLMYWLAINREPVSLQELRSDLVFPVSLPSLLEALESLGRRSLCVTVRDSSLTATPQPKTPPRFTLQPVVMEYVTNQLIEQICEEILSLEGQVKTSPADASFSENTPSPFLLRRHALIKAQAKDYVRASQRQLILQPLIERLLTRLHTSQEIEKRLQQILQMIQAQSPHQPGYVGGNILNLLCQLQVDLTGYDFSNLTIWQADLQKTPLRRVNFANADLAKSEFAKTFITISRAAFSPDGRLLATGHYDSQILLWDVENPATGGKVIAVLRGHTNIVWSVTFSLDGSTLISGSEDQTIKIWDVRTRQCLQTLSGHVGCIRSVVVSPADGTLISGSEDQTIRLWDARTGVCRQVLQGHTQGVWAIALSPDGTTLASASNDYTVRLWDMASGRCIRILEGHSDWLRTVAFSPDGKQLASGGCDRTIRLWDVSTGNCIRTLELHSNAVFTVVFLNQDKLASGSLDQTICLWDLSSGRRIRTLQGHTNTIYALAVHPQGRLLVSAGDDQTIRFWDISTGACIKNFQIQMNWIASVAFSPDGQTLASGSADHAVRFWQVGTGEYRTCWGHQDLVYSVAFSPDGQTLASGSVDQTIRLWDISTGRCRQVLQGHTAAVVAVAFSPNGKILASGSWDGTLKLWDSATGEVLHTFSGHFIQSLAFSPRGDKLAIGSFDETVRLWDITTKQYCQTFQGHKSWTWYVAFSPDGQTLATAGVDRTARLWDVETGKCLHILEGHSDWMGAIAFSPDGQTLATPSKDGTIRLWDTQTGRCLNVLQGHHMWVTCATFSPDSQTLVSGSGELTLKFWEPATGRCLKTWKAERFYEGMNITNAIGLTSPQVEMLKVLGAVEEVRGVR